MKHERTLSRVKPKRSWEGEEINAQAGAGRWWLVGRCRYKTDHLFWVEQFYKRSSAIPHVHAANRKGQHSSEH